MLCLCGNKLGPYKRKHCSDYCSRKYYRQRRKKFKRPTIAEMGELKWYLQLLPRGEAWFKLNHKEIYKKFKKFKII